MALRSGFGYPVSHFLTAFVADLTSSTDCVDASNFTTS